MTPPTPFTPAQPAAAMTPTTGTDWDWRGRAGTGGDWRGRAGRGRDWGGGGGRGRDGQGGGRAPWARGERSVTKVMAGAPDSSGAPAIGASGVWAGPRS